MHRKIFAAFCIVFLSRDGLGQTPLELRIGRAGHAFDHLGNIGNQADAAAASGATIIYATGVGGAGYSGLPARDAFRSLSDAVITYNRKAKAHGIELAIGYLCATSIVKLDTFDKNWTDEFRAKFKKGPDEWRQQDRDGKPLVSWYGGDYSAACMNNPDWRTYERAMVRYQLETGHDGIFFDNPTVHPDGCYCPHCMRSFEKYLANRGPKPPGAKPRGIKATREFAVSNRQQFMRFRGRIAHDFLADMRAYARRINPRVLVTCNNSLNAPTALFSQCRTHGYNIDEMSQAEDLVVVEDMASQPRTEANGQTIEYGATYKQLHAINHGKPIVAVTIAGGDYHTPPNLMRLAMAEAAANSASYLSWPTWPEDQRQRMIAGVRPQADFLRRNESMLNDAPFRTDVALLLPFQRWLKTDQCAASNLAVTLTKENIQYKVVSGDELSAFVIKKPRPVLLVESLSVLSPREKAAVSEFEAQGPGVVAADQPDWLQQVRQKIAKTSIQLKGRPGIRAVVHDQPRRTIVHLYNLNIERISSFDDNVTPAKDIDLDVVTPLNVRSVSIRTADEKTTSGPLKFQGVHDDKGTLISTKVPRLDVSAILVIEP